MMPPRKPLTVVKLSDHFGQYVLTFKCECSHTRTAQPQTLAVHPQQIEEPESPVMIHPSQHIGMLTAHGFTASNC